jgi:hypothetical protein
MIAAPRRLLLSLPILLSSVAPRARAEAPARSAGGCPVRVDALPASALFEPADPRLRGQALVVVLAEERRAMVFRDGALARSPDGREACWKVALGVDDQGVHPSGPKRRQGDRKTPQGWYRSSDKPWSSFAPAVAIHYPNAEDAQQGLAAGLLSEAQARSIRQAALAGDKPPQTTHLGGEILFHGGGGQRDWTWGCVALDDEDNARFRTLLPAGMRTDVLLLP